MTHTLSNTTIGKRIRILRQHYGMNQSQFAETLGLKQPSLSQIEQDATRPSVTMLQTLASQYNASYDWLLDGNGPMLRGVKQSQSTFAMTGGIKAPHEQSTRFDSVQLSELLNDLQQLRQQLSNKQQVSS